MSEEKKRNLCFILTILFSAVYIGWRFAGTIPWEAGPLQAAAGLVLVLAETVTTAGMAELMIGRMKSHNFRLEMPELPERSYPDIDVFIATHNEAPELLYKTINACLHMEYPDPGKVHVYVCDDGNRKQVKKLAEELGAGYLGLADNKDAKSGNYNHALSGTDSPLIATFDADMIPRRTFLLRTVPYFFIPDTNVGLIQTPQSFYNQDLFQFNLFSEKEIPNEQDFFSREINILRNSTNTSAYTGSNTVILRKAMEEIGGFPCDTITEDFETSIKLQQAGYVTYATSEVLAAGLSTTTVESMISQRIRWARGVIQSIRNTNAVFSRKLTAAARLSYLNAWLYWWSFLCRMIFILSPILFALFDFRLADCGFTELMIFWLPSHLAYSFSMRYLSTNIRNLRWSQIIDTILAPYLIIPVFLESVGIQQKKFKVTDKKKKSGSTMSFRYMIPHGILILLTAAAVIRFAAGKYGMALVYSSVILFWLFYNLLGLIYAVFFMLGRDSKRKSERIRAEEAVEIRCGEDCYTGVTYDVSEEGMSFYLEQEEGPECGKKFVCTVTAPCYRAQLSGKILYTKTEDGRRLFAAAVTPGTETDRRNWMQIIHDREHSLPKEMDPWITVYDEICRNVRMRWRQRRNSF